MDEHSAYWTRRRELWLEAQRCDATTRVMVLATPLYIFFPVFLLAVVPVFILIRRQRYLCDIQIERIRKKACSELSGETLTELGSETYSRLVVDTRRRDS